MHEIWKDKLSKANVSLIFQTKDEIAQDAIIFSRRTYFFQWGGEGETISTNRILTQWFSANLADFLVIQRALFPTNRAAAKADLSTMNAFGGINKVKEFPGKRICF
jgi:hypothetical protein